MADKIHPLYTDLPARAPPPVPAAQKNSSTKKLPPRLSAHRLPGRPRLCNPFCCCCGSWICSVLFSFLILVGVLALLLYLIFRPQTPKFSVTDAHISMFNLTSKPLGQTLTNATAPAYLQADVNFTVETANRNKRIGFYADQIDATLYYEDLQIGNGSVPPFYLGHKAVKQLQLEMIGEDTPLTQSTDSGLQTAVKDGSSIEFQIMTATKGRLKVWWWKSREFKLRVKCDVQINSAVAGGNKQLLSQSCKWKVVRFWL